MYYLLRQDVPDKAYAGTVLSGHRSLHAAVKVDERRRRVTATPPGGSPGPGPTVIVESTLTRFGPGDWIRWDECREADLTAENRRRNQRRKRGRPRGPWWEA